MKENIILAENGDIIYEKDNIRLILTYDIIDLNSCFQWAKHPKAGAISSFIGTTRDNFDGKRVLSLKYSCYPEMAISELLKLCQEAKLKFSNEVDPSKCCSTGNMNMKLDNTVKKILVVHRLGEVKVEEESIFISVTTPHRELGLTACQFLIDQIKVKVPIWKKEELEDGNEIWK